MTPGSIKRTRIWPTGKAARLLRHGEIVVVECEPWMDHEARKVSLALKDFDDLITCNLARPLIAVERALLAQKLHAALDGFYTALVDALDLTKLEAEAHNGSGAFAFRTPDEVMLDAADEANRRREPGRAG